MSHPSNLLKRSAQILQEQGLCGFLQQGFNFVKYRFPRAKALNYLQVRLTYYKHRLQYGASAPRPYKLLQVDVSDIKYWVDQTRRSDIDFCESGTSVVGGDWDQTHLKRSRTQPRFQKLETSFKQHFNEGVDWEDTPIYEYAVESEDPNQLYDPDGALDERLSQLDALYKDLQTQGYRTNRELQNESVLSERAAEEIPAGHPPEVHEIGIAITRDGELAWFYGGNHRLHLAKLLELENLPVRVVVRHTEWQELREEVGSASSIEELSDGVKAHLDHPDLEDLLR